MRHPVFRLRWLLACAGVVVVFSAIQVLIASVAVLLLGSARSIGLAGPDESGAAFARDAMLIILMVSDVVSLAIAIPWYRRLRRTRWRPEVDARGRTEPSGSSDACAAAPAACGRSLRRTSAATAAPIGSPLSTGRIIAGALGLGLGLQYFASGLLGVLVSLFPQAGIEYETMMESAGLTTFSLVATVAVVIVGPILEETVYRGIEFELARRVSDRFWVANIIQAACFGIAHLNALQGTYAFFIGLVLGMVYVRTGRLWPSMLCHATVNLMSYAPLPLAGALSDVALMAVGAAILAIFALVADLTCMQKT